MEFSERYGPWVLVTGASEGTGAEFARGAARRGLSCILIAHRQAPLDALAQSIRGEFGVECVTASIDLARPDAPDRIIAAADGREIGLTISPEAEGSRQRTGAKVSSGDPASSRSSWANRPVQGQG